MFWELSVPELQAVFEYKRRDERAANLRAGLICATLVNINRAKGAPVVQPVDFLHEEAPEDRKHMTAEESQSFLTRWAASINAAAKHSKKKAP